MSEHSDVPTADLVARGETLTVEFKRTATDKELAAACACLANGQGGALFVGVDDDGTVTGCTPRHGERTDPARVAAAILNLTMPALPVRAEVEKLAGFDVLRIDVEVAETGPIGTRGGTFTRRVLNAGGRPECVPMTSHEIVSHGMVMRGQDYAASLVRGVEHDDLDPGEFDRFRELCRTARDSAAGLADDDILRALGLAPRAGGISVGALLLFGRAEALQHWLPNVEFLFQDDRGGSSMANLRLVAPLLRAAMELDSLVESRNQETELYVGLQRVMVPLLPRVTVRESIMNALVHRDYSMLGPTTVQLTQTTFRVSSPGGFPPGVSLSNLLVESRPRSPLLADAFKRAGLVERRGKGINDMFEQQLRAGRDVPDYSASTGQSVNVMVSLASGDLDLVRFLVEYENEQQQPLGLDELRMVHEIRQMGSATATEIAETLGLLRPNARASGTRLVERGILEERGSGRTRRFHLSSRFYDMAQDRNAYIRLRPVEPLQQRRMIMDYVEVYGSITRSRAAELCQVEPTRARAILKELVEEGRLVLRGERRGSHYVAAGAPAED